MDCVPSFWTVLVRWYPHCTPSFLHWLTLGRASCVPMCYDRSTPVWTTPTFTIYMYRTASHLRHLAWGIIMDHVVSNNCVVGKFDHCFQMFGFIKYFNKNGPDVCKNNFTYLLVFDKHFLLTQVSSSIVNNVVPGIPVYIWAMINGNM